jgi:hypothetical protein
MGNSKDKSHSDTEAIIRYASGRTDRSSDCPPDETLSTQFSDSHVTLTKGRWPQKPENQCLTRIGSARSATH